MNEEYVLVRPDDTDSFRLEPPMFSSWIRGCHPTTIPGFTAMGYKIRHEPSGRMMTFDEYFAAH